MADENYTLPEVPVYREAIRKILNEDPVNAKEVLNPLVQVLLENVHFVKLLAQAKAESATLDDHIGDDTTHLTDAERNIWNGKAEGNHSHSAADVGAVPTSQKGVASGVATLDADAKVPKAQIPPLDYAPKKSPVFTGSISLGRKSGTVAGAGSVTEGCDTTASGPYSHAEGFNTTAAGYSSHAEGQSTTASASYSHAEGRDTTASGIYSHAEGQSTTASGYSSHAEGCGTTALEDNSHAEGRDTTASGLYSHAEGRDTTAAKDYSHAEGSGTEASGKSSHAEGNNTTASGESSHAEGGGTTASGLCSHAEGSGTKALGSGSHAEGSGTEASGPYSHAEGNNTTASGPQSHAEGGGTKALELGSHAEGYLTQALTYYSHAEGNETTASGSSSHAEGSGTKALGFGSHAEGYSTEASADYSHAEGKETTASGVNSHAGGRKTTASGNHSFAMGQGTIAEYYASTALGYYNVKYNPNANVNLLGYFLVVGKGTEDTARANALRVTGTGTYGVGAWHASGADYAELFEWLDGNPSNEDRAGLFVTMDGERIRLAGPEDNYILGIVSGNPSVVGDVYDDQWTGMFLADVFGRPLWEDVDVPDEIDDGGNVIIPAHIERHQKLNPDYDHTIKYTPRTKRPEWDAVGLLGKLVALDDGSCQVNSWATVGEGGKATASLEQTKYRVMSRLDKSHIRVMIL